MARYDKYDPISGGFRAPLAADFLGGTDGVDFGKVWAVGLNSSGQVTVGAIAANPGCVGVMILTSAKYAGDVVDIMTHGEVTSLNGSTPFDNFHAAGVAGVAVAGKKYYGRAADGLIDDVATANHAIGWTVEAKRLIVRVGNRAVGA